MRLGLALVALLSPLFVACALTGESTTGDEAPLDIPPCDWAEVIRVTDGDTIVVDLDGVEERVRYIGIDTPELAHFGDPEQLFAGEATKANADLVEDKQVCLERDISERDRYGRLLRYAWTEDGLMVNVQLLRLGLATIATYPPDVKYLDSHLIPAQDKAQEDGLGIWSSN